MNKFIVLLLTCLFASISFADSIGFKYWNAPYNDEDEWGEYDKSAVYGLTYNKNIDDDSYHSAYLLIGEYEQTYVDGSFSEVFTSDQLQAEYLIGNIKEKFDWGYGLRYISRSQVFDGDFGTFAYEDEAVHLIGYIGSSYPLNDTVGLYGGFTYSPAAMVISTSDSYGEATDGEFTTDRAHYNYEVGLYSAMGEYSLNFGYRKLVYNAFDDSDYEYYQDGITFSISRVME